MTTPLTDDPYLFTLALRPVPEALILARETIAEALEFWGFDEQSIYTGKLVANELLTNAIAVSTPEQSITLRTFLGDGGVPIIEVWDDIDEKPIPRQAGADDETGRGLALVTALTSRWGTNPIDGGGKVVWAELTSPTATP